MARKLRIALISTATISGMLIAGLWTAYFAVQQVRPFYHQALTLDPQVLEESGRELESRATALYSDTREAGNWHALFTADQINGWLATQLAKNNDSGLPSTLSEPRVALAPDLLTLGFQTTHGGVQTVVAVDASVFLTEEHAVAIRLMSVRAGALPLPVMQVADEIAAGCRDLGLPVHWTQQDGQPIAIVEISSEESADNRRLYLDSIELAEGELYVAGHTEVDGEGPAATVVDDGASREPATKRQTNDSVELTGYELLLMPGEQQRALEITRQPDEQPPQRKAERSTRRETRRTER